MATIKSFVVLFGFLFYNVGGNTIKAYEGTISPVSGFSSMGGANASTGVTGYVSVFRDDEFEELHVVVTTSGLVGTCSLSDSACGMHIHSGSACTNSTTYGGHLMRVDGVDPWSGVSSSTDMSGTADVTPLSKIEDIDSDDDEYPDIDGRPFNVHDLNGDVVACGILAEVSTVEYSASLDEFSNSGVSGSVSITQSSYSHYLKGWIIDPSAVINNPQQDGEGGLHVHEGTSCTDTSAQGSHYWVEGTMPTGTEADPWNSNSFLLALQDGNGETLDGNETAFRFSRMVGESAAAVSGKVFVYHTGTGNAGGLVDGDRAACGVLTTTTTTTSTAITDATATLMGFTMMAVTMQMIFLSSFF